MPKKKNTGMGNLHNLSAGEMSRYSEHVASSNMHSSIGDVHARAADRNAQSATKGGPGSESYSRWQHFYQSANAHYDISDRQMSKARTIAKSGKSTGKIIPKNSSQAAKYRNVRSNKSSN